MESDGTRAAVNVSLSIAIAQTVKLRVTGGKHTHTTLKWLL